MKITENNFQTEVLGSDIPVLVDFYADWCGPCKMLAPVLEQFESENAGKVKLCKVNVDDSPSLAMQFSVMSIPTLIVFKNGEAAAKSVGYVSKEQVEKLVF